VAKDSMHRVALASRVRETREELYGKSGGPSLAEALGLPADAWPNYENGVTFPGVVILGLIELTGADPHWLFTGQGDRYTTLRKKTGDSPLSGRPDPAGGP
jgi:hypothetical protein